MSLPFIIGNATANIPGTNFDANNNALGAMACTTCTATGTNIIALASNANQPAVSAYVNLQQFDFVAANTTTGSVTVNVNGIGAVNLYKAGGVTQAGTGDVVSGQYYVIAYQSTLNSNAGGFVIVSAIIPGAASAGALILLSTVNASGAASVAFSSTYITNTYNKYVIEFDGAVGSGNASLYLTVSTNNGSTYLSANYAGAAIYTTNSSAAVNGAGVGTAQIDLGANTGFGVTATTTYPASGTIKFSNPSTATVTQFMWDAELNNANITTTHFLGQGFNTTTTAINNIKIAPSTGTITGNFHLYGISGT